MRERTLLLKLQRHNNIVFEIFYQFLSVTWLMSSKQLLTRFQRCSIESCPGFNVLGCLIALRQSFFGQAASDRITSNIWLGVMELSLQRPD